MIDRYLDDRQMFRPKETEEEGEEEGRRRRSVGDEDWGWEGRLTASLCASKSPLNLSQLSLCRSKKANRPLQSKMSIAPKGAILTKSRNKIFLNPNYYKPI